MLMLMAAGAEGSFFARKRKSGAACSLQEGRKRGDLLIWTGRQRDRQTWMDTRERERDKT